MKKTTLYLMIMLFSLGTFTTINASENNLKTTTPTEIPVEVQVMLDRIEEIKEMDKSDLKRAERKELRKEVRAIKSNLRASGNGIYISSGAIIIILLLIIIL
mgnify:FL=1